MKRALDKFGLDGQTQISIRAKKYLLILIVRKFKRLVFLTASYYSHGPAPAISHSLQPDNKILSIRSRFSDFWLRQELKESQSSSVRPVLMCLELSILIRLAQSGLS